MGLHDCDQHAVLSLGVPVGVHCYIALNLSTLVFLCLLKALKKHCPFSFWLGFLPQFHGDWKAGHTSE